MQLIVSDIAAERGDEILFSGMDFTLSSGELLTIIGPNGVGKSTLLRIIAGLLKPLAGSVVLQEKNALKDFGAMLEKEQEEKLSSFHPAPWCHYLSTQNSMKHSLSVYDNLVFWASFLEEQKLSPEEALERVGIHHIASLPFRVLSTGQRRRAALARLLISYRPIWLLDEPTSGLDSAATSLVGDLITEHLKQNGMVIAATHLPLGVEAHHQRNIADYQCIQEELTL